MVWSSVSVADQDRVEVLAPTVSVLLLDDSEFDRQRIRRLFQAAGLKLYLEEADTLESFSTHLDEATFDVVLIDYNLTEGNGIDAVRLIQGHPQNSEALTVMITGDDQTEIAVQAMKMGCQDYISKTQLSAERLKEAVIGSLSNKLISGRTSHAHTQQIELLARDVLSDFAVALQPKLAKMLRDLRVLKRQLNHPKTDVPGSLDKIDRTCVELWKALSEAPEICISDGKNKSLH